MLNLRKIKAPTHRRQGWWSIVADHLRRNELRREKHLRVIIPDQLVAAQFAAVAVVGILVDFRNAIEFVAFPAKMMVLFAERILPRKCALAAQFAVKLAVCDPDAELHILIARIFESIINVIIENRCAGRQRLAMIHVTGERV